MGCILEALFEVVVEVIGEVVMKCYVKLMLLFLPTKKFTDKTEIIIKNIVTTVSVILSITLIIGLVFLLPDDEVLNIFGRYMTFIPLIIIISQITLGLIYKFVKNSRK